MQVTWSLGERTKIQKLTFDLCTSPSSSSPPTPRILRVLSRLTRSVWLCFFIRGGCLPAIPIVYSGEEKCESKIRSDLSLHVHTRTVCVATHTPELWEWSSHSSIYSNKIFTMHNPQGHQAVLTYQWTPDEAADYAREPIIFCSQKGSKKTSLETKSVLTSCTFPVKLGQASMREHGSERPDMWTQATVILYLETEALFLM